jgi:hypothetical protein
MTSKVFIASYACHGASDNLHPSVAGGSWILAGEFQKDDDARKAVQSIITVQQGGLPGPNTGLMVIAAVIKTA